MIETGWHVITFSHFNPPRTRTTTTSVRETRVGAPLKVGLWSLQQLGGIQYVHWLCTTLFWNCGCPDCRFILCNSCLYVLYFISSVYLNGFCISCTPFIGYSVVFGDDSADTEMQELAKLVGSLRSTLDQARTKRLLEPATRSSKRPTVLLVRKPAGRLWTKWEL